jgi:arylsulfatase A-like enzyme
MNILFVHTHDCGRYVQPHGYDIPTPNLQRLAEEGVLFRKAFSAAPTCSPSRAAMTTGKWPHSCGMFGLVQRGFQMPHPEQHIAALLKQAGYHTALVGIQHTVRDRSTLAYDTHLPVERNKAKHIMPQALHFLRNAPEQPFFFSVGFGDTHRPYYEPGPDDDPRYVAPPAPMPDTAAIREDMAGYRASARLFDSCLGELLATLADEGLAENTLVVCTTDHGIEFPTMKCNLTDHGTGVFLVMRGPHGFSGGKVVDSLVSHVDLFPTLCELAGAELPSGVHGHSLLPLVTGQRATIRDAVYSESSYHCQYEPQRTVRTERYRYIRRYTAKETPYIANCDPGPTKELWIERGWPALHIDSEQLYDCFFDPVEMRNLAADPGMADVLQEMRARLDAWMTETDDPLHLTGTIADPPSHEPIKVGRLSDTDPKAHWSRESAGGELR